MFQRNTCTTVPHKTGIRLIGVAQNPANGFPARLLGPHPANYGQTVETTVAIKANDLQTLLDLAEGYTAEHGTEAASKYVVPERILRVISNAQAAIGNAKTT